MNTLIKKAQHRDADAIQDTILTCWEKIHTLQQEKFFKTWLTRILINNCNQILRRKQKIVLDDSIMDMQGGREYYVPGIFVQKI